MGRGSSKSGGDGPSLSDSAGGKSIKVEDSLIIEEYGGIAPENRAFANEIEDGFDILTKDFPGLRENTLTEVDAGVFGGMDKNSTLGFYSETSGKVVMNANYTDVEKMNAVYDKSGDYHPSRGSKSGVQAVTFHEVGHALTDYVAQKMGYTGGNAFDRASKTIVDNAYKSSRGTGGTYKWAGKISKYAQANNAECIAEAVCDWYCNGSKASSASKAIMKELKKYR